MNKLKGGNVHYYSNRYKDSNTYLFKLKPRKSRNSSFHNANKIKKMIELMIYNYNSISYSNYVINYKLNKMNSIMVSIIIHSNFFRTLKLK